MKWKSRQQKSSVVEDAFELIFCNGSEVAKQYFSAAMTMRETPGSHCVSFGTVVGCCSAEVLKLFFFFLAFLWREMFESQLLWDFYWLVYFGFVVGLVF